MPLSIYRKLGLGEVRSTNIRLQLADRTVKEPEGIVEDVLVRAGKFIFPVDFVVLDFEGDEDVPLILGMSFLYTTKAVIDVYDGTLTLRVGKESCKFNIYQGMKHPFNNDSCFRVDVLDECVSEVQQRRLANCDELEYIEKCMQVHTLQDKEYLKHQNPFSQTQLPNTEPTLPSIIKPLNVNLKLLPQHLRYTFHRENHLCPACNTNQARSYQNSAWPCEISFEPGEKEARQACPCHLIATPYEFWTNFQAMRTL